MGELKACAQHRGSDSFSTNRRRIVSFQVAQPGWRLFRADAGDRKTGWYAEIVGWAHVESVDACGCTNTYVEPLLASTEPTELEASQDGQTVICPPGRRVTYADGEWYLPIEAEERAE